MKRGFKSQCERRSAELRKTLGVRPDGPLDAKTVAAHYGVTVWTEADVKGLEPEDRNQLCVEDAESWLAVSIRIDARFLIIVNSGHSVPRVNSMTMHELAHIILGHSLVSVGLTDEGYLVPMNYDQEQEDEANWFAGALLLPRPALVAIRRNGLPDSVAQSLYGVSSEMLQWRLRMTGVDYQLGYAGRGAAS